MKLGKLDLDQKGVLQVPMVLALGLMIMAAVGFWGILRHWRGLTELQLRLDRCVGGTAIQVRNDLKSLDRTNAAIIVARVGVAATMEFPPADVPFRTALIILVLAQDKIQFDWTLRNAQWLLRRGCQSLGDIPVPLPAFPFKRAPPDPLGPQALTWEGPADRRLGVQLAHRPRYARAVVQEGKGSHVISSHWSAQFSPPEELFLGSSRP